MLRIIPYLALAFALLCCVEPNEPDCPAATAPGTSVWAYEVPSSSAYDAVFVLDPGGELFAAAGAEIEQAIDEHFNVAVFWREERAPRSDVLFQLGLLDVVDGCPGSGEDDFGAIASRSLVATWPAVDGCIADLEVAGRLAARHLDWQEVRRLALDGHPGLAADVATKAIDDAIAAQATPYGFISATVDEVEHEPVRCGAPEWRDRGPWTMGDVVCFLGGKPRAYSINAAPRD